jgi:diadenosine tetraphosphate (Ap4A) HIT family hydrolase
MANGSTCIFCEIVAGRVEASLIYHDEYTTAFMDAFPLVPGHCLVVPNRHVADLSGLDDELSGRMIATARDMSLALRASGLRCEAVNLLLADGAAAGQTVFHSHIHILPRYVGDGFGFRRPPGTGRHADRAELDEMAVRIREGLGRGAAAVQA